MPDDAPQGAAPGAGPRKRGKIPTWGWVALAGGAVVLYYFYSKRQAAAAAAAASNATPAGGAAGTAAGSYGNAGDLAALAPYLNSLNGNSSTSGAKTPTQDMFIPLTASQAHNLQLSSPSMNVYYQVSPGVFSSIPVTSLNPWSTYGTAYLLAPSGYTAPTDPNAPQPLSGVIEAGGSGQ